MQMVVQDKQVTWIIFLLCQCLYPIGFGFPDLNCDFENMDFLSQGTSPDHQWVSREAKNDKYNSIYFLLNKEKT